MTLSRMQNYMFGPKIKISITYLRAANINYVVDEFRDMIGEVDGILLARDDAENVSLC